MPAPSPSSSRNRTFYRWRRTRLRARVASHALRAGRRTAAASPVVRSGAAGTVDLRARRPYGPRPVPRGPLAASGGGAGRAARATTRCAVTLRSWRAATSTTWPGSSTLPPEWLPALRTLDPATGVWDRLVAVLPDDAVVPPPGDHVRLLTPADAPALDALGAEDAWIHETWGGVAGLLAAGVAYAGTVDGEPVSIAVPFYVGGEYEDIGVVTVQAHRRRGLSTASAAAVVRDIRARGHVPTWTTSPDNTGSLAVAAPAGLHPRAGRRPLRRAHADPGLRSVNAPREPAGPAGTRPPPRRPGRAPRASRRCAEGGSSRWPR